MKPISYALLDYALSGLFVFLAQTKALPTWQPLDYGVAVFWFGFGVAWSMRAALEDHDRRD